MRRWRWWLAAALLVVPLLELYIVIQVGQVAGAGWTVVLLLAVSLVGAWLLGREGPAAWRRLRSALGQGRMPTTELLDGALILVGGALLLTPGFLTDAVGFLCVLPPTRPLPRAAVRAVVAGAVAGGRRGTGGGGARSGPGAGAGPGAGGSPGGPGGPRRPPPGRRRVVEGDIVEGEVVEGKDDPRHGRPGPDDGTAPR